MTTFSTNARHTTDSLYSKGRTIIGVVKHVQVFSLIGLVVLFTFTPSWAALSSAENHIQTEAHRVTGVNRTRAFRTSPDAKKSTSPLIKKSAGRATPRALDNETRWIHTVSVPNLFSYDVVQQPESDPYYVSSSSNLVTEFSLAKKYGTIGLVAHNNLAGSLFKDLNVGQEINIVYTDGHADLYTVSAIYRFRAMEPTNTESQFVDLDSKEVFTATELFKRMYTGTPHVTFQTCIYASGDASWGRLFAIATPVTEMEQ